jgi:hypothetical protein
MPFENEFELAADVFQQDFQVVLLHEAPLR